MFYSFRKKKVDSVLLNSFFIDGKNVNKAWTFSGEKTSTQIKPEQGTKENRNYLEVTCAAQVSLNFSNTLDFNKEKMYRFSMKLKTKDGTVSSGKNVINIRVVYSDISDKKSKDTRYNWFSFKANDSWEQKNVIILPPDTSKAWNQIKVTVFFEPGQYDAKDICLETW